MTYKRMLFFTLTGLSFLIGNGQDLEEKSCEVDSIETVIEPEIELVDSIVSIVDSIPVQIPSIKKVKDVVIYKDTAFYSSFPSIIKKPDGELLLAFRRAPDRKIFGEPRTNHVDPNSYLVKVRSSDNGETWSKEPELIYSHPFGGSQDPCLLQLRDGRILCTSFGWAFVRSAGVKKLKQPYRKAGGAIFLGGYLLRSTDGGETWGDAIYPPNILSEVNYDAFGNPVSAHNRGALYEAEDGRVLWIVSATVGYKKTSNHLLISNDKGLTWEYGAPVATDMITSFKEASVIETANGDIVGFLRTQLMGDQAAISRSTDGGQTFKWESMEFQGHPVNALRLPDDRVLLTYGYRHKPYGIRARILNPDCTDYATAPEFIIREDGGNADIGYTWPVQLDENRVLVVYYYNQDNGTRYIAGSIIEIE